MPNNPWTDWLDQEHESVENRRMWNMTSSKSLHAVRGFDGKSLAFGVNSQSNPMIPPDILAARAGVGADGKDAWGLREAEVIADAGRRILAFMRANQPPIIQFGPDRTFVRLVPESAVQRFGANSWKTAVSNEGNRWGSLPSLYCTPYIDGDLRNLRDALHETAALKPIKFRDESMGRIRIPYHTIIEMVRHYRAHIGESYIYFGSPARAFSLLDLSFPGAGAEYLDAMEQDRDVGAALRQCAKRGLIDSERMRDIIVSKSERKSFLDLFGKIVAGGHVLDQAGQRLDGILFTGANTRSVAGYADSFQKHFVIIRESMSVIELSLARRFSVRFDKVFGHWNVVESGSASPYRFADGRRPI